MPRKQRFKPSRKPKPIDTAAQQTTQPQGTAEQQQRPTAVSLDASSPHTPDVSTET